MLNLSPSGSIASNAEGHTSKSKSHPPKPMLPPMLARNRAPSPFADHAKSAIPRVHSPPVGTPPKHSATTGYRPLNVRDALTYLDQVKVQFSDQPDVYNRFLDIMKDFKSQSIDTPGVIERVSTLFKGHPTLISGFNTFLPPGYRIECSYDPREPDLIRVTTPSGTTTTTGGSSTTQPYYPSYGHMPAPPPQQMSMHSNPQSSMQGSYPPIGESSRPIIPQYQSNVAGQTQQANGKRGPVEFNHAINYVNKIKNRFTGRPETYKQFLEILQTYQKEQKPIQVVYTHVQSLFDGAPDLLDEFKQFLPEITGQPASYFYDSTREEEKSHWGRTIYDESDPYAYPVSPFDPVSPTVTVEEVELFERIRKHIGNKPSYEEFLKTLNLYTQQIITLETLIEQISTFLGNNKELFDWFKSVVSYEPSEKEIEPPNPTIPKPDLMHCKTVEGSPSYRLVPKSWQNQPCSGRDQLAWEVLNDEYVSHPIWASEDDGFVASKKSQYEEAMHRCEEERYDYNLNIEANLNTIALLEPIAKKIETMNAEEKAAMRLKPGLGGQSVTIYERIIKKVYDKERGLEIIELLYTNPAHVVPILLKRLKQKDEEWKKAQREWNKIWRELDAKNFYKALDYQGINFKSNDRKAMAPKSLINEIEVKYHRQNLPQKSILGNSKSKSKSIYQYTYPCKDPEVFKDVTRIIFSYIDRQTGFTGNDREKIRTFIRTFIPLWFHVEDVVPEGMSHYIDDVDEEDIIDEDEDAHSTNTDDSESEFGRSPGKRSMSPSRQRHARGNRSQEDDATMDLLRDVLTKNKTAFEQLTGMEIDDSAKSDTVTCNTQRTNYDFFCNNTFYCFFRLYETLYARLIKMKALDADMRANPRKGKRANKVAAGLGLYSNRFDGKYFLGSCIY
ncbi:Sin3 family co-repressor-domain-containing protein [Phycomyces blakesleeanus]|uniref:Sin3 family co-repressor-domain-containing protein n=1 Tax=Phycomyces blakesleeanus TaxID=4837 RepID=A0ABR3BFS4_PHYBL